LKRKVLRKCLTTRTGKSWGLWKKPKFNVKMCLRRESRKEATSERQVRGQSTTKKRRMK